MKCGWHHLTKGMDANEPPFRAFLLWQREEGCGNESPCCSPEKNSSFGETIVSIGVIP